MNVFINVLLTFSIVYGFYILFSALMSSLAERELENRGIFPDENGNYTIECDASSLEFVIRCALWATTFERHTISVIVSEYDNTSMFIAESMRKKHRNIVLRRN